MISAYWISLDVHSKNCQFVTATPSGQIRREGQIPTTIPAILQVIRSVRKPRQVIFEEGPLAGWIYRCVFPEVDDVVACDPRRNAYIAKDGDKDDAIDARKLLQLGVAGFVRKVHHSESLERAAFKRHVSLYRDRVGVRVAEANRLIGHLRSFGVVVQSTAFKGEESRATLFECLPDQEVTHGDVQLLLDGYDAAMAIENDMRLQLIRMSRRIPMIKRFTALPGVSWIRGATFYAYIDTPWRFKSKSALHKYMGVGLEHSVSGSGFERLRVPQRFNRPLKDMILGAAKSAARTKDNPFADQHERWLHDGCSPRIAQRNTARSLAAVMWGMFKNNGDYRPDWVGKTNHALTRVSTRTRC